MRIDTTIICENARTRDDGALDLIGLGVDTFNVAAFPAIVTLPLFVRVVGDGPESADLLVQTFDSDGGTQSESFQPIALGNRPPGLPDDCPVLIGQVPLELMDFVVDPNSQRLIGNPAHGGVEMLELY